MWTSFTICRLVSLSGSAITSISNPYGVNQTILNTTDKIGKYKSPLSNCDLDNVVPDWYIMHPAEGMYHCVTGVVCTLLLAIDGTIF
jgi:hypothetical protein